MNIRLIHSMLVGLIVLMGIGSAQAQQAVSLRRTYQTGERWATEYSCVLRIKNTEGPLGSYPSPGISQDEGKYDGRVVDATNGSFRVVELSYGKVTVTSQHAGARRATTVTGPMSSRRVKVERRIDPDFNEEKIDVSAEGTVLTPDMEDTVRAAFKNQLVPAEPVTVGAAWDVDEIEAILGPATKGRLHMQLVRIESDASGRSHAVIQVNGSATTEVAAKMPSASSPMGGTDLVVSATMSGTIRIDTSNGLVSSIELAGPARLEHGGSIGEPLVQNADFTYRLRSVAKAAPAPVRTTTNDVPPARTTPTVPTGFAGTYRNDQLTVELKSANGPFSGTITVGDQRLLLKATTVDQGLQGTFESAGASFPFTATLNGDKLQFTTDGIAHVLQRKD